MRLVQDYDRAAVVRYAKQWALKRNPAYYDYEKLGGDCTNFASQCVYAGSRLMNYTPDLGWYYIDANRKAPAWTGVGYFWNFMTRSKASCPVRPRLCFREIWYSFLSTEPVFSTRLWSWQ